MKKLRNHEIRKKIPGTNIKKTERDLKVLIEKEETEDNQENVETEEKMKEDKTKREVLKIQKSRD